MPAESRRQLQLRPSPLAEHAIDQQVLHVMSRIALMAGESKRARHVDRPIVVDLDGRAMVARVTGERIPRHVLVKTDRDAFVLRQIDHRRDGFRHASSAICITACLRSSGIVMALSECGHAVGERAATREQPGDLGERRS